jgi:DNA-binding XRE family transcriptional regulator
MITTSITRKQSEQQKLEKIAAVVRAGRKLNGLTQVELSQRIGVSQSWVSKVESAILVPHATEWFEMCRLFSIDSEESFYSGVIDNCNSTKMDNLYPNSLFNLPRAFKTNPNSKVRAARPFVTFLEEKMGPEKLSQYFRQNKLDPDFFVVLDNQISIEFLLKLLSDLIGTGILKRSDIAKIAELCSQPESHGLLSAEYNREQTDQQRLAALIKNSPLYETNFSYEIAEQNHHHFALTVSPQPHLSLNALRRDGLEDALCQYKQHYFKNFIRYAKPKSGLLANLTEKECLFKGDKRCLYKIEFAA